MAKNYLSLDAIDTLNRLTVVFLEQAKLRVKERKQHTLDYWRTNVNRMLQSCDRPILTHAGTISHDDIKSIAEEQYEAFDSKRRATEVLEADAEDIEALEQVKQQIKHLPRDQQS